jgi:hypothetical protein
VGAPHLGHAARAEPVPQSIPFVHVATLPHDPSR